MKAILKTALVIALLALVAVGWMAWRNDKVRRDTRQAVGSVKGAVNEELIKNAERLAERLRAVQRSAETNKETRK
jgi:Na+-translocating ferredoxin:NAD+ oxidoreductase RnfG subunit